MSQGVTKGVVQQARNALLARGIRPSIDAVRTELGNTGSRSTIHRYLKELEAEEFRSSAIPPPVSAQVAELVGLLAQELQKGAQQIAYAGREALILERDELQYRVLQRDAQLQQLEHHLAERTEQLLHAVQERQHAQEACQSAAVENARLTQATHDLEKQLQQLQEQLRIAEEVHERTRHSLEQCQHANRNAPSQELIEARLQNLQQQMHELQRALNRPT